MNQRDDRAAAGRSAQRRPPPQPAAGRRVHSDDERRTRRIRGTASVAGARSDQQNVTLDGIDVNDPQLQAAYTSAVRMTQEALQEFRVSTSNYGAEAGRSSGPQVSLVTRSGTNSFNGSGYWLLRRTDTSSNEYFLKLPQVLGGNRRARRRSSTRTSAAARSAGRFERNKMFFFGNFEKLRENSESPVVRAVPSDSFRDGVLHVSVRGGRRPARAGTVQGFTGFAHDRSRAGIGLTPAQIAALDPLGIGPSRRGVAVLQAVSRRRTSRGSTARTSWTSGSRRRSRTSSTRSSAA